MAEDGVWENGAGRSGGDGEAIRTRSEWQGGEEQVRRKFAEVVVLQDPFSVQGGVVDRTKDDGGPGVG